MNKKNVFTFKSYISVFILKSSILKKLHGFQQQNVIIKLFEPSERRKYGTKNKYFSYSKEVHIYINGRTIVILLSEIWVSHFAQVVARTLRAMGYSL